MYPGLWSVFPQRLNTALPYVDELTLTTSAGVNTYGNEYSYRLNSLYDPYFSAGGHQPYGFDQLTTIYNRYLVSRVDLELTFSDPTVDGLMPGVMLKNYLDATTLVGNNIPTVSEFPTAWTKAVSNTGSQKIVFRKSVDLAAMMGLTKAQYESGWPSLAAVVTADPSISPYMTVAVADPRSGGASTITCNLRIVFHAQFWERKLPSGS